MIKPKLFDESACLVHKLFKGFVAVIGVGILHHFDLVELMSADHAALFASITARFLSETRGICEHFHREFAFVDDFARVNIHESGFRSRQHKAVFLSVFVDVKPIHFVRKLGELSRAESAVIAELQRRKNKFVSVFQVLRDKEIQKRPFQPCADAAVHPESAARQFHAAFVVDKIQACAKVDVVFGRKVEFGHFADDFLYGVVFLAARNEVVVGKVGKTRDEIEDFFLQIVDFLIVFGNFFTDFSHFVKDCVNGFALFFQAGNVRRHLVFSCFQTFDVGNKRASFGVPREKFRKVDVAFFLFQRRFHRVGIAANQVNINHIFLLYYEVDKAMGNYDNFFHGRAVEKGFDLIGIHRDFLDFVFVRAGRYDDFRFHAAVDLHREFEFVLNKGFFVDFREFGIENRGFVAQNFPKFFRKMRRKRRKHFHKVFDALLKDGVFVGHFVFVIGKRVRKFHNTRDRRVERKVFGVGGDAFYRVVSDVFDILFGSGQRIIVVRERAAVAHEPFNPVHETLDTFKPFIVPRSAFDIGKTEHKVKSESIAAVLFDESVGRNYVAAGLAHFLSVGP